MRKHSNRLLSLATAVILFHVFLIMPAYAEYGFILNDPNEETRAAIAAANAIRALAFEYLSMDGHSMDDTLKDGDILLITKYDYTTLYIPDSQTGSDPDGTFCGCTKVIIGSDPELFDIVACRYPKRGDINFIKRVVGLPGDTLEIKQGYLYVNGTKYDEPYINDAYRDPSVTISYTFRATRVPAKGDVLMLKNGVTSLNGKAVTSDLYYVGVYDGNHRVMIQNGNLYIENPSATYRVMEAAPEGTEITILEDNFFVMGDHRNNSNDSRSQGALSRSMIYGKAVQTTSQIK